MTTMRTMNVNFPDGHKELYEWAKREARGNDSWVGREAFECYRLVTHLAGDTNWREWLEQAEQVMRSVNVVHPESEE